jgi:hypothetical protein
VDLAAAALQLVLRMERELDRGLRGRCHTWIVGAPSAGRKT